MKKYAFLFILLIAYSSAQTCYKCKPQNCTGQVCTECENGFMLSSLGWCGLFTPIEGCRIYDVLNPTACKVCNSDRQQIGARCYIQPDGCEQSDLKSCLRCKSNYVLQRGKCLSTQVQNCPIGSLPTSQFCQPLRAQNCLQMSGDDKICSSCQPGYNLINGRCLRVTSTSSCPNNNCDCSLGFKLAQVCYRIEIDKCTFLRDPVYCAACQRGFVAIDGICLQPVKQDDVNCNVKAPLSDYCTGCNQDYQLNIDAFCYRNFSMPTCPVATGYFYIENGNCFYRDMRCDTIDQRYQCLQCQQGFTLINQVCQRNICTQYSANGTCVQVFLGYAIVGYNQYIKLPANCLTIDVNGQCTKCSDFTRLVPMNANVVGSANVCAYVDPNCILYNSNGSCLGCANSNDPNGYVLRGRACFKKADNCPQPDPTDLSKCLTCAVNYHLDSTDSRCYANVAGCEVYLTGSDCKQCQAINYILYDKKCFSVNSDPNQGCIDFDTSNNCRRCPNGLMPWKNICVYYHPYCLNYGPDLVCSQAAGGWTTSLMTQEQKQYYMAFMMRGAAVRNRNEAVNLAGLSTPTNAALAGSYYPGGLIGSFPYAGLLHSKISGVNLLGIPSGCNQGYTPVNFACIQKVVPNCEFYSIDETCMRCSPGYTLLGNFTCVVGLQCATPQDVNNGRCNNCADGYLKLGVQCFKIESSAIVDQYLQYSSFYRYYYSSTAYVAWPRLANCRTQTSPSYCSECQSPYQNFNGSCIMYVQRCVDYGLYSRGQTPGSCLYCENGYTYWFGQCRKLNCAATNGICNSCPAVYYYYFGLCLANALDSCRVYDNAVCATCNYGYYISPQNQCLQSVSGCLTTNGDTGRCLECRYGMVLYRERCVIQQKYCEDYDFNTNACIRCQMNSVNRTQLLPSGSCALLVGQCATVDINTKVCSTCNPSYSPITQDGTILCVNLKTNCLTYDVRGRCIQCNKRYVLINNQCRIFSPFCVQYNNDFSQCIMCAPGSSLQNGCCKVPDPNCISYSTDCLCNKCLSRYYLNSSGLCAINEDGCDIYDFDAQKCAKCTTGYYYLQNIKKCVLIQYVIDGCLTGFNITYTEGVGYQCLKCIDGFVLKQDNLCYGYNCIAYHPVTRQCLNCPTYYQIYRGNSSNDQLNYCIPYFCELYTPGQSFCAKNVTTYTGGHLIIVTTRTVTITYCQAVDPQSNRCLTCTNFRYPNPQTLYGLCYPLHCKSQLNFDCQQCQFGYGFNPQYPGSCVASFCSQYRNDGTCSSCILPYTLNSLGLCQNKGCCDQYNVVQGVCQTAKKYYLLQGNLCVPNNCVQFDVNVLTMCTKCLIGSTLFADGTCRVNNCQQETFGGDSCLICKPGFVTQFSPTSLKSICVPNYCDKISDDLNTCLKCKEGFTLGSDLLCRADFCAVYQSSLVCQTCVSFFTLDKNQRCNADCQVGNATRCQCCKYGSTLNTNTGLCQSPAAFCAKNNTMTGLCDSCNPTYNLIMGQCVATMPNCKIHSLLGCVTCNPGFSLVNNCRCLPKNCNQVGANGYCVACQPRFDITPQGLCRPRDCQIFAVDIWACNSCYSRFKFMNGACVTTNCQIWDDPDNTTCKQCGTVQQYSNGNFVSTVTFQLELVNGGCYIKYCKNDPRTIACKQCAPGYKLTINGLCECANYDASNQCVCPDGTVYNKQTGYCDSDTCLQRDFTTKICLQCPVWYYPPSMYNGECVPIYCVSWQLIAPGNIQCRQCPPNFDLINGLCKSSICQTFQNKTGYPLPQCTVCSNGWIAYSNYCIPPKCQPLTYNITSATCIKCTDFGYILTSDRSRCMIANCQIQKLPISCSKCKVGYRFINQLCISNNCTTFNDVTCTGCMQGFYLQNQKCYAYNCANFGNDNLCIQCIDGFKLVGNYTCVRQFCDIDGLNACIQCIRGYTYSASLKWCVPSNCLTYSQFYTGCDKCSAGYYKENGTCIDIRCDILSFTKEMKCIKCQNGLQFNNAGLCYPINNNFCPPGQYFSGGACVANPVPSCQIYDNNTCLWCIDGFFLWNGLCYSIRYCTKYSYYFGCSQCVVGYFLSNRQCLPNVQDPTCIQANNGVCTRCQPGYSLVKGRCYLIPPNCLDVNELGNCIRCAPGFTPVSNICQSTDVNCLYFDSLGRCSKCRDGFNVDIQGKCQLTIKYCNVTDSMGRCTQCNTGYVLQNYKCYRLQPFCTLYSQTSQLCVQCSSNFTLQASQCRCLSDSQFINNQLCIKFPSNCLQLSTFSYSCVRCAQGYTLTPDFRCTIFVSIDNCSSYDPQTGNCKSCFGNNILVGNRCQACQSGYFASNNQCYIQITGCIQYFATGTCKTCQPGMKLDSIANTCTTITPPSNCLIYDPLTGICSQCRPTFTLINNNCVACPAGQVEFGGICYTIIVGCVSYSNTGACTMCSPGWSLGSGTCMNITLPPSNCMTYNLTTGICYQCMRNYVLSGNTCIPCPAGQVQVSGKCYIIIVGCLDYLTNGDCRLCQVGKKLDSGKCVAISAPPFCAIYQSQTGICTKCITGYTLTTSAGTAVCILNNCLTPSTDGKSCITCIDTFTWTGQQCRYDTEFCLSYFNGRCQTCDTFTLLTQYRCVPNFCSNYDYARGYCISCMDKYQLTSRRCIQVIDGCSSYQINGCATCLPGYTLISPTLCQKQQDVPKFCTQYNYTSLLCVTCAPNYMLSSDFKYCILINCGLMDPTYTICNRCLAPFSWNGQYCVFITDFCIIYGGSGYCSSCQSWSRLDQNRCVPNFCLNYNYGTGNCETCVTGYTLSLTSRRCFVIIQYCLAYADTGLCMQCMSGYTLSSNGQLCTSASIVIPSCYAQVGQGCARCQHRYYVDTQMCSSYIKYCINIDPSGRCIACCFGSTLVNGVCQKQSTIKYCQNQLSSTCLSCLPGYSYCSFCQTCLPSTPNCNRYQDGSCVECYQNFMLVNGVCISQPVGVVLGATGTCRTGYYSKDSACYRNENDLKLYSTIRGLTLRASSNALDFYTITTDTSKRQIVIFAILVSSQSAVNLSASFLLYYRSKISDPLVCWNSCIPTQIDSMNFTKNLAHPIVASEIMMYVVGGNLQSYNFDFKVLA